MTTQPGLIYPAAPPIGRDFVGSIGRFTFSAGRRLDLPREYGFQGDRELGWASIHLGYCYVGFGWR